MRSLTTIVLGFGLIPSVLAACATSGQYNTIPRFAGSNGCVPPGYYQAEDEGQPPTTQSLIDTCDSHCTNMGSRCQAYVAQIQKAADSNLMTGQCYYYSTPPTSPARCADHPTDLIARAKDNSLACFSSSASAATAYCSSYLSIGVVTSYTSTFTPTSSTRTTTSTTSTTSLTRTTTTTTTTPGATTSTSTSTLTTATTATDEYDGPYPGLFAKRQLSTVQPPACLTTAPGVSASRISSACSCLSITSSTTRVVSTAAPSVVVVVSTSSIRTTIGSSGTSTIITTAPTPTTFTTTTTSTIQTIYTDCRASCPAQIFSASQAGKADCTRILVTTVTTTQYPAASVSIISSATTTGLTTTTTTTTTTSTTPLTSVTSTVSASTTSTIKTTTSTTTTTTAATVTTTKITNTQVSTSTTFQTTTVTTDITVTSPSINPNKKRTAAFTAPTYASSCSDYAAYSSGCSCNGITATTTTVTVTATTSITSTTSITTATSLSTATLTSTTVSSTTSTRSFTTTTSTTTSTSTTSTKTSTTTFTPSFTIQTTSTTTTTTSYSPTATVGSKMFNLRIVGSPDNGKLTFIGGGGSNHYLAQDANNQVTASVATCLIDDQSRVVCNTYILSIFSSSITDSVYAHGTATFSTYTSDYPNDYEALSCSIGPLPNNYLNCKPFGGSDTFLSPQGHSGIYYAPANSASSSQPAIQLQAVFV